jgi:hypothetical protein
LFSGATDCVLSDIKGKIFDFKVQWEFIKDGKWYDGFSVEVNNSS